MDATSADRHPAYQRPLPAVTAKEGVAAGRPNVASSHGRRSTKADRSASQRAGSCGGYLPTIIPVPLEASMNSLLAVSNDPFELDVQIVTEGPVAAALLADTDDGCDTVKGSDC